MPCEPIPTQITQFGPATKIHSKQADKGGREAQHMAELVTEVHFCWPFVSCAKLQTCAEAPSFNLTAVSDRRSWHNCQCLINQ